MSYLTNLRGLLKKEEPGQVYAFHERKKSNRFEGNYALFSHP